MILKKPKFSSVSRTERERALGVTDNEFLLKCIAQYVKFIQLDEEKIGTVSLSEIIKNQQENK